MPKKKTVRSVKKTTVRKSQSLSHIDDLSFMIIAGGGLVILLFLGYLFVNSGYSNVLNMKKMQAVNKVDTAQTVSIKNFEFQPQKLTVKLGSTVQFVNDDSVEHAVVADDLSFDTKSLAAGEKGSYTFTKAGVYTYKCSMHPSMTGQIIVEE